MMGEFTNLGKRLSDLSLQTTSQAVIILRRKQLLAHAGNLPSSAIQELAELINSFSNISAQNLQKQISPSRQKTGNGDMVRFIQLQSTQGKYLLYAISLSRDILLALVFDNETQFSKIRRQTVQIARDLLTPQPISSPEHNMPDSKAWNEPSIEPSESTQPATAFELSKTQPSSPAQEPQLETLPSIESGSTATETILPESGMPNDDGKPPPTGTISETDIVEKGVKAPSLVEVEKAGYYESAEIEDQAAGETPGFLPLGEGQVGQTRPEFESNPATAPISFGHYITYSCLLIPRMPQHLLTSNLSSYLFKWLGQLCLAFGWRLEHLSIHSSHIQWIAGAPLTISPAFLVRTLRQKTSQYIFTQFPTLTNENPSGDFWAPGFFITGGKQTIQPHLIDRYINEIRIQQGVYNSTSYQ